MWKCQGLGTWAKKKVGFGGLKGAFPSQPTSAGGKAWLQNKTKNESSNYKDCHEQPHTIFRRGKDMGLCLEQKILHQFHRGVHGAPNVPQGGP